MKGFMFSIDSIISLGLILIAATTLWTTINETNTTELIAPNLENTEINTLYFNEPSKELDLNNQKCQILYSYDSITTKINLIQTINQKIICEGN